MNCTRCLDGPIEFIYRIDWLDHHYCPHCNLEQTIDIKKAYEVLDQNTKLIDLYGE